MFSAPLVKEATYTQDKKRNVTMWNHGTSTELGSPRTETVNIYRTLKRRKTQKKKCGCEDHIYNYTKFKHIDGKQNEPQMSVKKKSVFIQDSHKNFTAEREGLLHIVDLSLQVRVEL